MELTNTDYFKAHPNDIAEYIAALEHDEQFIAFMRLPGVQKSEVFSYLSNTEKMAILRSLGNHDAAELLRNMSPDDRTDFFSEFPDTLIKQAVSLLSDEERKIALSLIGYPEKSVGRIMTPYYVQAKRNWTVQETFRQIKQYGKKAETLNFIYIVDDEQRLINDMRIGQLLLADEHQTLESLISNQSVNLVSTQAVAEAITIFEKYDREALPVVSESGILVGIVTIDDILDQIEKRDTEVIQKFGGLEALDLPYTNTSLWKMIQKRAGWLIILFVGEMLTASAMGHFDEEIRKAVVLALFVPLIISSGGNSGSQAATLIIRALALKELKIKDWWYVLRKEIASGFMLGVILGAIGLLRIFIWQEIGLYDYGQYWLPIALSVSVSLIFIVLWGTMMGSMIPFVLKRLKLDPATSSAPFVATLIDVTGLLIYFSVAAMFLNGKLL